MPSFFKKPPILVAFFKYQQFITFKSPYLLIFLKNILSFPHKIVFLLKH